MVGGFTTAAVINYGFCHPKEPVSAMEYMPNHQAHKLPEFSSLTQAQRQADNDFELAVLNRKHQILRERAASQNND